MKAKMTVAIPVRNKNMSLITNFAYSLKWNLTVKDGVVRPLFIDLGSKPSYSDRLRQLVASVPNAEYEKFDYSEWNKPLALNCALKLTDTEWFAMLDADYILEKNFFGKILDHAAKDWDGPSFLQCRGYDIPEEDYREYVPETGLIQLMSHKEMKDAIFENAWEPRPKADYGGFQAVYTEIAKAVNGYDTTFRLYGGMHHEFRNRLLNWGAKEHRLHGNPVLLHQPHPSWTSLGDEEKRKEIKEERERHRGVIQELAEGERMQPELGLNEVLDLLVKELPGSELKWVE